MIRIICFTGALVLAVASADAEQYWIAYEGNDFPENVGWERHFGSGGAARTIRDGLLVLDSLHSDQIYDDYVIERALDPEPGELFVATWRLRVVETPTWKDAGIYIARDEYGDLGFDYSVDEMTNTYEDFWTVPITPYQFHTYRLESGNMLDYSLWIDGEFAHAGQWDTISLNRSFVVFGDQGVGASSLTEWDYVRFGVVPEPHAGLLLALGLFAGRVLT